MLRNDYIVNEIESYLMTMLGFENTANQRFIKQN